MATMPPDVGPSRSLSKGFESGSSGYARLPEMASPGSQNARAPSASPLPERHLSEPAVPDVDERLVMPETRFEILDGEVEHVAPADELHGSCHSKIAGLLEAHIVAGYDAACDMLTRTSAYSDVAPDASVFPAARDPVTGGRQLEEIAFEVVSTERLSHTAKKARTLIERGVRRVIAVDVEQRRVLEWSGAADAWQELPDAGEIEDRVFVIPLSLQPLVDASKVDDAMARALIAKDNPVIRADREQAKELSRIEGEIKGKIKSLLAFFAKRGILVSEEAEAQIWAAKDVAQVDRWLDQAYDGARPEDLLE